MRTIAQIKANTTAIHETMCGLLAQIDLLENDYQVNAVKMTGSRCEAFDEILKSIKCAYKKLAVLWRMETDLEKDLIYGID